MIVVLEDEDGVTRVTLAELAERTRVLPDVVATTLRELDRRDLVAIAPIPGPDRRDAVLEIVASPGASPLRYVTSSGIDKYLEQRNGGRGEPPVDNLGTPGSRQNKPPDWRWTWAERATDLLADRTNAACYHAYARRYPREVLDRALGIAIACPEDRVRTSRGALFVAMVKRLAAQENTQEGSPENAAT